MEIQIEKKEKKVVDEKLRVVAYTRVSSLEKNGFHSSESQKKYYQNKISSNSNWILVGIYSDDGISGGNVSKRHGFLKMMIDAERNKYDFILTKSISRFARNTLDTIKYVRYLKNRGIGVYFEEENINTLDMSSEMILTILSSVAQQEIINLSESIKYSSVARMKRGEINAGNKCFGYDFDYEKKNLVINPEEAEIVKTVFDLFIKYKSYSKVASILNELKVFTIAKKRWTDKSIKETITNITYTGNIMLQKYFSPDPTRFHKKINNGYLDKYYIKNNHEPIISMDTFKQVEKIICELSKQFYTSSGGFKLNEYSHLLKCGLCGSKVRNEKRNYKNDIFYSCAKPKSNIEELCLSSKYFKKETIDDSFLKVVKKLRKFSSKNENYRYIKNYLIENKKFNHTEFVKDLVEGIFLGDETDNYSISFVLKNNNLIPKSIDFNKFKNNGYLRLLDFYEYRKIIFMDEDKLINITDGYDIVVYLDEDY